MISKQVLDQYEMTIGIECHVQFNTKTKLFAAVDNDATEAAPNTLVSPICFGMPGVLPVMNEAVIDKAIMAGLAMNAEVAEFSKFDRKHYFYPDLPKGYQITQFEQPIVGKGEITIHVDGEEVKVGITRAHLEEDAGKSTHPSGKDYSLVDLNRAGTPLLEIVSEPDIHSAAQARAYAQELYLLMKYAGVSNVNLFHGNMRFDVNLSVAKKGAKELGIRSEVKNLNSFKSVERAAEYEFIRQVELLEKGQEVVQETRGWDDAKQKTFSQRSKEEAHDYRYFPDPDIPPVVISADRIAAVKQAMPLLPSDYRSLFADAGISAHAIEVSVHSPAQAKLVAAVLEAATEKDAQRVANWFTNLVSDSLDASVSIKAAKLPVKVFVALSQLVESGKLSSTGAKSTLDAILKASDDDSNIDPESIAKQNGLIQVSDQAAIEKIVDAVIAAHPQAAQDVQNGEAKAIGFLVGQVMKESKGSANPQLANQLLRKKLNA